MRPGNYWAAWILSALGVWEVFAPFIWKYGPIIDSQAKMTPWTWQGRIRLNTSGPMPPNASGTASSVAMIMPNVVTTTNHTTLLMIQSLAAVSGYL